MLSEYKRAVCCHHKWLAVIWILSWMSGYTMGAPPQRNKQSGPCVGMDCLHGVLMHGDEDMGDDHKAQDTFERLKQEDAARQNNEVIGPCEGLDCLHNLMHDSDGGSVKHMDQKMGPEAMIKEGPEEGMEYLHGVMMHGDEQPGRAHKVEDEVSHKDVEHPPDGPCIDCMEGSLHSTHLNREPVDETDDDETELPTRVKSGTFDPDSLLHGEADGTHHNQDNDETKEPYRIPGSVDMDPEKYLHRDGEDHKEKDDTNTEVRNRYKKYPKFGTYDIDSALHGSDGEEDVHDPIRDQYNRESDGKKTKFGTFDPDSLLHGGVEHAHHTETKHKKPKAHLNEFKQWLKQKLKGNDEGKDEDEDLGWGFSFPYISDSFLDDIEEMKQRYLIRPIWGESDDNEEETKDSEESGEEEEIEYVEEYVDEEEDMTEDYEDYEDEPYDEYEKELSELTDALMDNTEEQPCVDCDENKAHAHGEDKAFQSINVHDQGLRQKSLKSESKSVESESDEYEEDDMRHELGDIGSTKPLKKNGHFDAETLRREQEKSNERLHGL